MYDGLKSLLRKLPAKELLVCFTISVAVFFLVVFLRSRGVLEFIELKGYDFFLANKSVKNIHKSPIVIIGINTNDFNWKKEWPLTDETLAQLLHNLTALGPRVIGLDIYRDIPIKPGEEKLRAVFDKSINISTIMKLSHGNSKGVPPVYALKSYDNVGFSDLPIDEDGTIRRGLLFADDGQNVYYSFALITALLYLQQEGIYAEPGGAQNNYLRLGSVIFNPLKPNSGPYVDADTKGDQFFLDFEDSPFQFFSLKDALTYKIPVHIVKDKIVLIGMVDEALNDFIFTPLNVFEKVRLPIYGVEGHGHIVGQLLRAAIDGTRLLETLNEHLELWLIFFCCITGLLVAFLIRDFFRFTILCLLGFCILVFISFLLFEKGLWIPFVPSMISFSLSAWFCTQYLSNKRKKEKNILMQLFSKHVSKDLANTIWQQKNSFLKDGRPRSQNLVATVMFTDIKDFSTISETMDANILITWLNEYLSAMANIVEKNGGVINKYIGDAVMAVFGVPVKRTSPEEYEMDAQKAVNCAIKMGEKLKELNEQWQGRNLPTISMRVGIHTGALAVGSIGSASRLEYTVIGDVVNIASRLESYGKDSPDPDINSYLCRILIGESTAKLTSNKFLMKPKGKVVPKGKKHAVTIYLVTDYHQI